jgi:hypothetical protein
MIYVFSVKIKLTDSLPKPFSKPCIESRAMYQFITCVDHKEILGTLFPRLNSDVMRYSKYAICKIKFRFVDSI